MKDLFSPEKLTPDLQLLIKPPCKSFPMMLETDVSLTQGQASASHVPAIQTEGSPGISQFIDGYTPSQSKMISSMYCPEDKDFVSVRNQEFNDSNILPEQKLSLQLSEHKSLGSTEFSKSKNFLKEMSLLKHYLLSSENQSLKTSGILSPQKPVSLLQLPEKQSISLREISKANSNDSFLKIKPVSLLELTDSNSRPLQTLEMSKLDNCSPPKETVLSLQSPESQLPVISKCESEDFVLQREHFDDILDFYYKVYENCKCDECGKSFESYEELEKHWEDHNVVEKPSGNGSNWFRSIYRCQICGKVLRNRQSLVGHLGIHTGKKPHACHLCDKTFVYASSLAAHVRSHNNVKTHFCEVCNKGFACKANVRKHMRQHTGGERNLKCDMCACTFYTIQNLNAHKRTHSDDRPIKCHLCPSSFKHKGSLNIHLLVHSNKRPFECKHCDSCFKSKSELKRHNYIHSEVKPYQCYTCGKGFSQKGLLRRHFKIHPEVDLLR